MSKRTVFSAVAIAQRFQFLGNPIVWEKVSDFSIVAYDCPYPIYDEAMPSGCAITGSFRTDAIVDIYQP